MPTRKQQYMNWLTVAYKVERIQRTDMPFKMRLAAIVAADNRPGRHWV